MKGYRLIPVALAMLAAGGCSIENPDTHIDNAFVSGEEMTFTAGFAAPDTKTEMHGESAIWWTPGDEICIWFGSSGEGNRFISQETESTNKARFNGTISAFTGVNEGGEQNYFWAVYPYESAISFDGCSVVARLAEQQIAKAGSFETNTNVTLAKSTGLSLSFYNICSGIRFSVTHEGIKSVTFRGNNNEDIAGTFRVSMGENGKPTTPEVINGKKEIILSVPNGGTFEVGPLYYIEILPQTLTKGFTMTFTTETASGSRSIDVSAPFERSVFSSGLDFDQTISFIPFISYERPELVDLGLSVKWATWNIGATKPEELGDYFAWGELQPKNNYSWSNYRFGSSRSLTKYCYNADYGANGFTDMKYELDPEDDVAYINFGENWRIPSRDMLIELLDNCSWSWKTVNKVKGYQITSKINGNSIFMPASGYYSGSVISLESELDYWMSSLYSNNSAYVISVTTSSSSKPGEYNYISRSAGLQIRPVYGNSIPVDSISMVKSQITLPVSSSCKLDAEIYPSNATNKRLSWSSSKSSVAKIDSKGVVTAVAEGTAILKATSEDGGLVATCGITVTNEDPTPTPVDLGLSVKWASKNVGAILPEDFGSYYAWGEIETKQAYSWGNYKWGTGTEYHFTKYNYDNYYGDIIDNQKVLLSDDDIATQKYGGRWHIPTYSEMNELVTKCDWEHTTVNGVNGFLIKSRKNTNSIFLPLAGHKTDMDYVFTNFSGDYWSSSLLTPTIQPDGGSPMYGCAFVNLCEGWINIEGFFRTNGLPVRAVYK